MPEGRKIYFDDSAQAVDLGAPSRIVRGRLPAIEAIQDRLSRQLRLDLFQYLRYGVQIEKAQTNFEPHDEVMRHFNAPVLIGIISMAPLRGFSIIAIDGNLVGSVVDRLCGAAEPAPSENRDDFSIFEMRIARRLLGVIQDSLKYAWQGVTDLSIELVRTELNTSFIAIADAQEPLITMRMKVAMATGNGEVVIAIPYPSIEPIRDKLTTATAMTEIRDEDKRYWNTQMREALSRVGTEIRVELTRVSMQTTDAEALTPGQVIPIRVPPTARAYCGDTPLFEADFGSREGAVAVRIQNFLDSNTSAAQDDIKNDSGFKETSQSEDSHPEDGHQEQPDADHQEG